MVDHGAYPGPKPDLNEKIEQLASGEIPSNDEEINNRSVRLTHTSVVGEFPDGIPSEVPAKTLAKNFNNNLFDNEQAEAQHKIQRDLK